MRGTPEGILLSIEALYLETGNDKLNKTNHVYRRIGFIEGGNDRDPHCTKFNGANR